MPQAILNRILLPLIALFLACTSTLATSATIAAAPPPPQIDARGYIIVDFNSGNVIAEKKSRERMEPASLTKMMTAYIVLGELASNKVSLDDKVRISEKAWRMQGSRTFVEVGKQVPLETLLKGLIVQSGNDATVALAEHIAGAEEVFATMMNQTATALGMNDSHFVNSTGLPEEEHYTTASDMATLARALVRDHPDHYPWYSIKKFTYNGITQPNRNTLLWKDDRVDGIKTGHTESAGYCLVASAKEGDTRLISVVLGAKSENGRAVESKKLISYGFRFFETHRLYAPHEPLTTVRVWKGDSEELPLGLGSEMYVTIPRGQYDNLNAAMKITPSIIAPVEKGQPYGNVEVSLDGKLVAQQPLISLKEIPEGGFFSKIADEAKMLFE
ncbi:D-alanyl-D-alanine carboxypeptidase family protein [Pseudomonadota bacterium]